MRSSSLAEFNKGRQKVLAFDEDAVVGPLVLVLYGPNERYRALLVEALAKHAQRGCEMAKMFLQDVAVGDGSRANRARAIQVIQGLSLGAGKRSTDRLMAHLALDEVPVLRDRAAEALSRLQDKRAVWLLVERLVTEEFRLTGAAVTDYDMQFDIRFQVADLIGFRQVTISAAAPLAPLATTTIDLPEVQIIDLATTVAMTDRHVQPEFKRTVVQHPGILAALKQLTGMDFGYDQGAWQRWLQSKPEGIPAWEPIRLSSDSRLTPAPKAP
jgi:head-tail adaptor